VISYLDRLREIGASERMVQAERDAWILVAARWPDHIPEVISAKHALLDDLAFDLLDAFAVESDPRVERLLDRMRERGWTGWTRRERLVEPPG
jgi:hypothetical protein